MAGEALAVALLGSVQPELEEGGEGKGERGTGRGGKDKDERVHGG